MKIVMLGSVNFAEKMLELKSQLIELGQDVYLSEIIESYVGMTEIDRRHISVENKNKFDLIKYYFELIKKNDAIFVVNETKKGVEGYIGGNVLIEMGFAYVLNKKIFLLNNVPELSYSDEIKAMKPIVLNGDLSKIK